MKYLNVLSGLLIVGNALGQDQKTFDKIGEYFDAKVTYSTISKARTGKENINYIDLNLTGGPYVRTDFPDQLSACVALLLYANLNKEEVAKYTHIKINLFNSEAQEKTSRIYFYETNILSNIAVLLSSFKLVEELLLNGTPEEIYDLFVEKFKVDGGRERFVSVLNKMKVERSGIESIKLLGIKLLIDDTTKERFIGFNGVIAWGNTNKTTMMIETYEDPSIKGISSIDIK